LILLIGNNEDPHLIEIKNHIKQASEFDCKILSTSRDSLLESVFEFSSHNNLITIKQENTEINPHDVRSAFCLSPMFRIDDNESQEARFWYQSWKESLFGFYEILRKNNVLLNTSIDNSVRCQNKIKMYDDALKAGVKAPCTIITNKKELIDSFLKKHNESVIKTLHQISLKYQEEPAMILVQKVSKGDLSEFSTLNECPIFLQQFIEKSYDIRLIVIGETIIACKIDASKSEKGRVDWRAYDLPNTPHTQEPIPNEIEVKIFDLMRIYELDYACIDLCVDQLGDFWLLDINPFGKYLWIEYATGVPITKTLSEYLISRHRAGINEASPRRVA